MGWFASLASLALLSLMTPAALAQQGGPVATLEARLQALEGRVATLEADLATANGEISSMRDDLTAAEDRIAALESATGNGDLAALAGRVEVIEEELLANTVLDLHGYLFLDIANPQRPVALFEGINVQITNGTGQGTPNGLGNLIVGFDLPRTAGDPVCSDGQYTNEVDCQTAGGVWARNHKSGSHNLVVGPSNSYSQTGGVVFGELNAVNRLAATVTGGAVNTARGAHSSVSGGIDNTASGDLSSVSGGGANIASGARSSVSGGGARSAPNTLNWAAGGLLEPF